MCKVPRHHLQNVPTHPLHFGFQIKPLSPINACSTPWGPLIPTLAPKRKKRGASFTPRCVFSFLQNQKRLPRSREPHAECERGRLIFVGREEERKYRNLFKPDRIQSIRIEPQSAEDRWSDLLCQDRRVHPF